MNWSKRLEGRRRSQLGCERTPMAAVGAPGGGGDGRVELNGSGWANRGNDDEKRSGEEGNLSQAGGGARSARLLWKAGRAPSVNCNVAAGERAAGERAEKERRGTDSNDGAYNARKMSFWTSRCMDGRNLAPTWMEVAPGFKAQRSCKGPAGGYRWAMCCAGCIYRVDRGPPAHIDAISTAACE